MKGGEQSPMIASPNFQHRSKIAFFKKDSLKGDLCNCTICCPGQHALINIFNAIFIGISETTADNFTDSTVTAAVTATESTVGALRGPAGEDQDTAVADHVQPVALTFSPSESPAVTCGAGGVLSNDNDKDDGATRDAVGVSSDSKDDGKDDGACDIRGPVAATTLATPTPSKPPRSLIVDANTANFGTPFVAGM